MSATMHRAATLPDGKIVPAMYTRPNDPKGAVATIGYFDDDKGFVTVAQEVDGDLAPMLAQSSTLYYIVDEQASHIHSAEGHAENAGYPANYRECPMVACQRAARALLGADRQGPLV